jgi:Sulfotransferase family
VTPTPKGPRRPLFAVGTGRCGSTLLSSMMRLHPRILSVSEWFTVLGERRAIEGGRTTGDAFWRLLTVPGEDAAALFARHPSLPEVLAPDALRARAGPAGIPPILLIPLPHLGGDAEEALRDLRAHVLAAEERTLVAWHDAVFAFLGDRYGKASWLERSGGSLAYVDGLPRSWRDARYVHIYRDGPACAWSMSRHPYFRVRVARALSRKHVPVLECLEATIPLEQFGAYWSALVMRGIRVLREVPREDVIHVRYEDLVTEPVRVLRRVQRFLEGDVDAEEWIGQATACIKAPEAGHAVPASLDRLARACRAGMSELASLDRGSV